MGSKKVEEKLQTLIHAFYEQKELSAKDIQNLLVCNRASTYNYIERLKERGFELESTTRNKTAYYTLISEDPSAPPVYYLPISKEILRKYNVIQNLQRKHDTAKLLKDRYFLPGNNSKTDDNCDKLPMDITKTAFDNLWNALIQEKEIAITSDGTYHATGRSVPILHHFSKETVSKLLEQVKLLPAASPYHSQLNSIAHKLEIIKLSDNLGSVSSPNYLTYGKQHEMLEEINQWMKKLSDSSYAEKLIPACDISEQISLASKEASGTGNMKFMLNGAPTLGTMDGANVEIVEEVGAENAFIFGLSSDEVINYENNGGYDPNVIYNTDEEIRQVLMQLINGTFSNDTELFRDLYDSLLNTKNTDRADRYFILADFRSYADAQKRVEAAYRDEKGWAKKALLNTACSGKFTSDRTIQEYVDDIWHLDKVIVRKK